MSDEVEDVPKTRISMVVRLSSRDDVRIGMGEVTPEQIQSVNSIVSSAMQTLNSSRDFNVTDETGVSFHFNMDHVTCIEVRVG